MNGFIRRFPHCTRRPRHLRDPSTILLGVATYYLLSPTAQKVTLDVNTCR